MWLQTESIRTRKLESCGWRWERSCSWFARILNNQSNVTSFVASSSKRINLFYRRKTVTVYGWVHFKVMELRPFSIVENEVFFSHAKFKNISSKTLEKYLGRITKLVEWKISQKLPDKLVIIIDGWSTPSAQCVLLYTTYPSDNENGYQKVLPGSFSFRVRGKSKYRSHVSFIKYVLSVFKIIFYEHSTSCLW